MNHSTGIPMKTEEQWGLALSLVQFFTANPTFEVPSMKLTAAEQTLMTVEVDLKTDGEARTTEPLAAIAAGQTVQILVQAVNAGQQGGGE